MTEYKSKHRNPDTLARKMVLEIDKANGDLLTQKQIDSLSVIGADMLIEFVPQSKVKKWLEGVVQSFTGW